jgi:hypothetical protein
MASCISWSSDFSPSAIDWIFYKYQGLTVRNLSLRRTSLTCDSGSIVVCFLIASLRCCRKVRGFSLGHCCKAKLLSYIGTFHSGEQVSELFWASVSSFLGVSSIGAYCKWLSFLTWVAWARTHCIFDELRVWSSRSICQLKSLDHRGKGLNVFVWHQYSCLDVFKFF